MYFKYMMYFSGLPENGTKKMKECSQHGEGSESESLRG